MTAITCEGLTKRYGSTIAVDDLSLAVPTGSVFGFLGSNGAGKTTTMRMLLGLVTPTGGRMWVNGRELPDPDGLANVGAMIEEPAFYPWMTGRANLLAFGRSGSSVDYGTAVEVALARVRLLDVADRLVRGYSQGMRQRLGLALALLRQPALLMLDEPTNGLDPVGIREFRALLQECAADGVTVFLSSHLLSEVEQVCDEVAVLRKGRLIKQGPVDQLVTTQDRVRVLVAPSELARARAVIAHTWPVRDDGEDALVVQATSGLDVNRVLTSGGVWASEIRVERATLEEIYLDLTGDHSDAGQGDGDAVATR